jgi:hypothetical protein
MEFKVGLIRLRLQWGGRLALDCWRYAAEREDGEGEWGLWMDWTRTEQHWISISFVIPLEKALDEAHVHFIGKVKGKGKRKALD